MFHNDHAPKLRKNYAGLCWPHFHVTVPSERENGASICQLLLSVVLPRPICPSQSKAQLRQCNPRYFEKPAMLGDKTVRPICGCLVNRRLGLRKFGRAPIRGGCRFVDIARWLPATLFAPAHSAPQQDELCH